MTLLLRLFLSRLNGGVGHPFHFFSPLTHRLIHAFLRHAFLVRLLQGGSARGGGDMLRPFKLLFTEFLGAMYHLVSGFTHEFIFALGWRQPCPQRRAQGKPECTEHQGLLIAQIVERLFGLAALLESLMPEVLGGLTYALSGTGGGVANAFSGGGGGMADALTRPTEASLHPRSHLASALA
jgi:hypothetical protein